MSRPPVFSVNEIAFEGQAGRRGGRPLGASSDRGRSTNCGVRTAFSTRWSR